MSWSNRLLFAWGIVLLELSASSLLPPPAGSLQVFAQQPDRQNEVPKPSWGVGDSWEVETTTERIQVREAEPARRPARLRWRFRVAGLEDVAGSECYRIDIECLAKGRLRPASSIWCDKETLFLRQFQTQVANNGKLRVLQESYAVPKGQFAPVVAPINALPIALPAFVPPGSKNLGGFTYTSAPAPAGSKDVGLLRFSYSMQQRVGRPSTKSLGEFRTGSSKSLEVPQDVTEITLDGPHEQVVQLWKKDSPWPVFTSNGRTRAWLITEPE